MLDKKCLLAFSSASPVLCAQDRHYLNAHTQEVLGHLSHREPSFLCAHRTGTT